MPVNVHVPPDAQDTTYPLVPGTAWKYTAGRADSVSARVTIGTHEYFRIDGTLFPHVLARMENGLLLVRESEASSFESVGDSWAFAVAPDVPTPTVTLVSKTDEVTVPAGTFSGCYTFFFDVSNSIADDLTYVVAPNVGLVKLLEHSGVTYELTEYDPAN